MKNLRVCLFCTMAAAPLGVACSDDLPQVETDAGSTSSGGMFTTTGVTTPTTGTTEGSTESTGTTVSVDDGSTTDVGLTTEVGTTEGTTEVGTTEGTTEAGTTEGTTGGTTDTGTTDTGTTAGVDDDTIYEIQDGTIGQGVNVDVQGVIVTGVAGNAFFAQEPAGGQYSGVYVFLAAAPTVAVGDEIDIIGTTAEFNDLTEIDASVGTITPTGVVGMDLLPEVLAQSELTLMTAEPWEGVLVRIEGAPLTVVDVPGFSEFDVNDGGADDTRIDNFMYSVFDFPGTYTGFAVGASFTAIQGPLNYFGSFKVAPRDAADLEGYMGGPPPPGEPVDNLVPGDLVITEVMYDPTCAGDDCEWLEVYNDSGMDVNLLGLRIQDSTLSAMNQGIISESVFVPAGSYVLLAKGDAGTWPYMLAPASHYGGSPGFNNGAGGDLAAILNSVEILDQTATYPTFGALDDGISWKLDPMSIDAVANDDVMNWCHSSVVFDSPLGVDELGSPAAVNEAACSML